MPRLTVPPDGPGATYLRAEQLFDRRLHAIACRTDRLFAGLLAFQWVAAVATALVSSPRSWAWEFSRIHVHVWVAILLGGAIAGVPIALTLCRAGATSTRLVIAVAQASMGALLIHLSGGRIEVHFQIFASLALLAFYRDWRVLVTASVVVALDHLVRGLFRPQSVYGVLTVSPWRWAEHAGWIAIEDIFLIRACLQGTREMRDLADQQAEVEATRDGKEQLARDRTADLHRGQKYFADFFENAEMGLHWVGPDGRILRANRAELELLGYDRAEYIGHPISEFHADREIIEDILRRLHAGEALHDYEARLRCKDGTIKTVLIDSNVLREDGRFIHTRCFTRDVTGRKRIEEALRESEERFRGAFEAAAIGIGIAAPEGRWLRVNHALCAILGYSEPELLATTFQAVTHPDDLEDDVGQARRLLAGEIGSYHFEKRYLHKLGHPIWVRLSVSLVRDPGGRPLYFVGLIEDITPRKRAGEANARLVAILDATTDFVGIADAGGRVLYVNAAGRELVGMEADVSQTTIRDYFSVAVGEIINKEVLPTAIRDGVWSGEVALLRRDGHEIPVSMVALSHKDAHGNVECVSTIARDVTERNRAEQEIRCLNAQLEQRLDRLKALQRVDTAMTSSFDLGVTLSTLLEQVNAQLGVDAANVILLDPETRTLKCVPSNGFRTDRMQEISPALDWGVLGPGVLKGFPVHLPEVTRETPPFARTGVMEEEGFVAYSAVALLFRGAVRGILEVFHRSPLVVDREWLDFLKALAGQAAIAIDGATVFEDLQRTNVELTVAYDATIEGWSQALDLRDKETEGHTRRVTEMSVNLARVMGIVEADLIDVRRGALLHDVGKLGIPDAILLKPGKLTDEEWVLMRRHPVYAQEWLAPIAFLREALTIPYCHHEKFDGTGYPRGLKGEEIPLAARIFAAVDIWDALRSDRPYRRGWPEDQVLDHIQSLAGTELDPAVVHAFQGCLGGRPAIPVRDVPAPFAAVARWPSNGPTGSPAVELSGISPGLDEGVCEERLSPGGFRDAGVGVGDEAASRVEPSLLRRSGLTILVAEDRDHPASVLKRTLEAAGHEVILAADGEEAWRHVEKGNVRVVIADRVIPRLPGLELCRRIRRQVGRPYTYVILVTSLGGADEQLEAFSAGADDFLTRPVDPHQLDARLAACHRILSAQGELEGSNSRLIELAVTDDLTGLKNRRYFRESLDSAYSLASRRRLPLSLVLLDVDHFKDYNDTFGHPAGDDVLSELAEILREQTRPCDLVARHGGEEFVLLLTADDADGARAVAERMRAAIEGHPWPVRGVTASFGIATTPPECLAASDLIEAADLALYDSKRRGRNLVTHSQDLLIAPLFGEACDTRRGTPRPAGPGAVRSATVSH